MTLTTSTITGRVPLPTGATPDGAHVTFTLTGYDTEGANTIPPASVSAVIQPDASLPPAFTLWRNTEGLRGTTYTVTLHWLEMRDGRPRACSAALGPIQVGDDASYTLADLLAQTPQPVPTNTYWRSITQQEYDDAIQAVATAEQHVQSAEAARDEAQAWAESPTPPGGAGTQSAKTWAEDAETFRDAAEAARDAAQAGADVYPTTGAGIAATSNGDQFMVAEGDEIVRYENSTGSAVEVARYPSARSVPAILGNLSTLGAVIGQLSRQVNGGRINLVGGTLDDPAITIGNVAIYSAAADTLSIAVAGVEVLRITPSGLMTKDEILEESL